MERLSILVTGANGQLGQEFAALEASHPGMEFNFFSRASLDIGDKEAVEEAVKRLRPAFLINCAAYTAVDKAEGEEEAAFRINAEGARNLARACNRYGTRLIHISTDYVFSGDATSPYKEEDATSPMGVYGASKLRGEEWCLSENPEALIIRTAWVFSAYGNNFVKTMLRLMASRDTLNVVADQQGCPTYAADLAGSILQIISSGKWTPGIYHYSNGEPTTWFHFAETIRNHCQLGCDIVPITTEQYPTPAKRPKYSVLSTEKICLTYGIKIRSWKEALGDCLAKLNCSA